MKTVIALLSLSSLAALVLAGCTAKPPHPALAAAPRQIVWAWERVEDLRFLPPEVGVAYVASTVELRGANASVRPRLHSLYVRSGTTRIPLVHVDADFADTPLLLDSQAEVIVQQVLQAAARDPAARLVQLDFEVRVSQRAFYAALVARIRAALPAQTALSVTALASWCVGQAWLDGLAADEIVPMAFRMGRSSERYRARLVRDSQLPQKRCQSAIGTASDEPLAGLNASARRYYFSPKHWTPARFDAARAEPSSSHET